MYLTKDELKTVATKEVIDLITQGDEQIVTEIIAESIDLMASYLYKYYDTEAIFAKEGDERSKILLKYLKDIVIHEIYIRRSKTLNQVAKLRYDEAMLWLEKIAKGEIEVALPTTRRPPPSARAGCARRHPRYAHPFYEARRAQNL